MRTVKRGTIAMTLQLTAIFVFASFLTLARAEEASVEVLKAGIEGVYVLQEWHRNGEVFRPPLVDARVIYLNGQTVFISYDGSQETKKTFSGYGIYVVEVGEFSYRYERVSVVSQTARDASVSEKLPWDGLRRFAASINGNEIHFKAIDGPQESWFTPEGLIYSDGTQKRIYRRITEE